MSISSKLTEYGSSDDEGLEIKDTGKESNANQLKLPEPKATSSSIINTQIVADSSIIPPQSKKKIQIFVPNVASIPENEEDELSAKKIKTSGGASSRDGGLFSFLPAPKNVAPDENKNAPTNKKPPFHPRGMNPTSGIKGKEGANAHYDFFSLDVDTPNEEKAFDQPSLTTEALPHRSSNCIDLNPELEVCEPVANQYRVDQYQYDYSTCYPSSGSHFEMSNEKDLSSLIDPNAVRMLSGRAFDREGPMQIKEVSRAEQIGDAWKYEALKAASKEKEDSMSKYMHLLPSSSQKRKHNIMSLAFEAKQRQAELQEQAANRRLAKKASGAKYGF